MKLLNSKLTEDEKYQISIDGINERYEAEKKKIKLTISDETDKNRKLEILNINLILNVFEYCHLITIIWYRQAVFRQYLTFHYFCNESPYGCRESTL